MSDERLIIDPEKGTAVRKPLTRAELEYRTQIRAEWEAEKGEKDAAEQRLERARARSRQMDFTTLLTALNNSTAESGVKLILRQIVNNQIDIMNLLGVSDYDPEA